MPPSILRIGGIASELSLLAASCVLRDIDDLISDGVQVALPLSPYLRGIPDKARMLALTPAEYHAYLYSYRTFKVTGTLFFTGIPSGSIMMTNRLVNLQGDDAKQTPLHLYETATATPPDFLDWGVDPSFPYKSPGALPGLIYPSGSSGGEIFVGAGAGYSDGMDPQISSYDDTDGATGLSTADLPEVFSGGGERIGAQFSWFHQPLMAFFSKKDALYYVVPPAWGRAGYSQGDLGASAGCSVVCAPFALGSGTWYGDAYGSYLNSAGGEYGGLKIHTSFNDAAGTFTFGSKTCPMVSINGGASGYAPDSLSTEGTANMTVTPTDAWEWTS